MSGQETIIASAGTYTNTGQVPKGADIWYRCLGCGRETHCNPSDSFNCQCKNIILDIDYMRLAIKDFQKLEVFRREKS